MTQEKQYDQPCPECGTTLIAMWDGTWKLESIEPMLVSLLVELRALAVYNIKHEINVDYLTPLVSQLDHYIAISESLQGGTDDDQGRGMDRDQPAN